HAEPLPLGTPNQPYSKGLMARALVAVGVPLTRAYELAKRIEQDLADRHEESVELDRFEELAVEVLGEVDGSRAGDRLRRFREQTRYVLVGVGASIERALEEGWSMVLEGVHLVPGMLPRIDGALVVQCVLAIDDEEEHSTHFMVRDAGLDGLRPHAKYIDRLDDIRRVQDYIVGRARRHGVPVIANADMRSAIDAVLERVLASAEQVQRV